MIVMNEIIKNIKTDLQEPDDVFIKNVIDPLFDFVRDLVGKSLNKLNKSRSLMRTGTREDIKKGQEEFERFKEEWSMFSEYFQELIVHLPPEKVDKSFLAIEGLIKNSVSRRIHSKIPMERVYLEEVNVSESDIDWIIGKMQDYWGKYAQTYASSRVRYFLR